MSHWGYKPFPRLIKRKNLLDVIEKMQNLLDKSGISSEQLVSCAEIVRDNNKRIDVIRGAHNELTKHCQVKKAVTQPLQDE